MKIDNEIIKFKDPDTKKLSRRGWKVGNYLVVSYITSFNKGGYRIFRRHDGKPFLDVTFQTDSDAIQFATWMDDGYRDFFPIWESYPDADIIALARWSIKNGVNICEMVKMLNTVKHKIGLKDVASIYHRTKDVIQHWRRFSHAG